MKEFSVRMFFSFLLLTCFFSACKKSNISDNGGPNYLGPIKEGYLATVHKFSGGKKDTLILTGGSGPIPTLKVYHQNLVDLGEITKQKDYFDVSYTGSLAPLKIRFTQFKTDAPEYITQFDANLAIWDKMFTVLSADHPLGEYQLAAEGPSPYISTAVGKSNWIIEPTTGDKFTMRSADFENIYLCTQYIIKIQGASDYSYHRAMGFEAAKQEWFFIK